LAHAFIIQKALDLFTLIVGPQRKSAPLASLADPPTEATMLSEKALEAAAAEILSMKPIADGRMAARSAITAYLSALKEEGLVIVPSEPTEAMRAAADGELDCAGANDLIEVELRDALGVRVYRTMLSAYEDGK
jgi:DNA-binding transcriptional ArsR family regulator